MTEARAQAHEVCPHAIGALSQSLTQARAAKEACENVIKDHGATTELPGDGTAASIKAIVAKLNKASAFVNSLLPKK